MRADRFSPYFERPGDFGITITPNAAYPYIYPAEDGDIGAIAYHFQIESPDAPDPHAVSRVEDLCRDWRETRAHDALGYRSHADGTATLFLRRGADMERYTLDEVATAILDAAWTITTAGRIASDGAGRFGVEAIEAGIAALAQRGLLMREGEQVLAIPYRDRPTGTAPTWDEIRRTSATRRTPRSHVAVEAAVSIT